MPDSKTPRNVSKELCKASIVGQTKQFQIQPASDLKSRRFKIASDFSCDFDATFQQSERRFGCDFAERSAISNRAILLRFEIAAIAISLGSLRPPTEPKTPKPPKSPQKSLPRKVWDAPTRTPKKFRKGSEKSKK